MEHLVELLKPMLKNPNAITFDNGVIHLFTADSELVSVNLTDAS
jgi:hypothetical protein